MRSSLRPRARISRPPRERKRSVRAQRCRPHERDPRRGPGPGTVARGRRRTTSSWTSPWATSRSTRTRRCSSAAPSRAPRPSSTCVADKVAQITLNGRSLDPRSGLRRRAHPPRRPGRRQRAARCARPAATCTPARGCTASSTRSTSPCTSTPSSRSRTRGACSRCSSSPTSRPPSRSRSPRPTTGTVVSNEPTPEPEPVGLGNATWRFAATPSGISSYITALVAGPYHRLDGEYRDGDRVVPLSVLLPRVAGGAPRRRRHPRGDPAGLRVLRGDLRHAVPVREVRPALRPGVQLRRDGERRLRHAQRGLRLPLAGPAGVVRATGSHDPARDGPHVVRRPRDDDVVGRPLAQRVVRRVGQHPGRRRGHPWTSAWTTFANTDKTWAYRQDQLPVDAPDRGRDPRPRGRRGQLRRHHLRQGRRGPQAARGLGRPRRRSSTGSARTSGRSRGSNTTLADLLGKLEETSGRDLKAWSAEWLETAGVNTLRAEFETDDEGRFTSFAVAQTAPEAWPTLRSHRLAIGLYERTGDGLVRTAPGRARRRWRVDRDARTWLVGARPDLVLVNDDDLTYAKVRLDERSLETLTRLDGRVPRDAAPLAVLVGGVGHDP